MDAPRLTKMIMSNFLNDALHTKSLKIVYNDSFWINNLYHYARIYSSIDVYILLYMTVNKHISKKKFLATKFRMLLPC